MKFLAGLLVFILIVAGLVLYIKPEYRDELNRLSDQALPAAVTQTQAYRWQDKNGQWQLSDRPPPAGTEYEIVQYHKDTNVIPSENLTGKK